nr:PREDICTED: zinc finger protein 711-like [Bemisia tabaci]
MHIPVVKALKYVSKRTSRVEPTTRLDVVASTSEPAIQWEDADSVYQPEKIQRWKRNSASTTHDGRFMCDLCEKTYKWKGDLNRHMKYECQHVIGKPSFDCPHCDYSTVRPSYLKYHMEEEYQLVQRLDASLQELPTILSEDLDLMSFCAPSMSLSRPKSRSRGGGGASASSDSASTGEDRPFTCELCSKSYKRKVHLQRHERFECRNVLEKPNFGCSYCSYSTSRVDNLKSHVILQHHFKKDQS